MTVAQIEKRLKKVEQVVEALAHRFDSQHVPDWYATHAGRFANDPVFDEIVRLGEEYRASQRPPTKAKRARSR